MCSSARRAACSGVAYAWLPAEMQEGEQVEISYFGKMISASIVAEPLVDPGMVVIRA